MLLKLKKITPSLIYKKLIKSKRIKKAKSDKNKAFKKSILQIKDRTIQSDLIFMQPFIETDFEKKHIKLDRG
jgi:hypothetical protein